MMLVIACNLLLVIHNKCNKCTVQRIYLAIELWEGLFIGL